jgi:hypothetical protein
VPSPSNNPGFEPGVPAATRRALFDLRRKVGLMTGLRIVGTIPGTGPPTTPGSLPGDIIIDGDGNGWSWDGTTWINIGPIQGPPGPQGPQGPPGTGGGGSGFTYVQTTMPTATVEGETWWNSSADPLGGTSWLAVSEVVGAPGPLIWVQFAPGAGGGEVPPPPVVSATFNQGTPADVWEITHNLDWYPNVTVMDSGGSTVEGDLIHLSTNALRLTFSGAFSGVAYLS